MTDEEIVREAYYDIAAEATSEGARERIAHWIRRARLDEAKRVPRQLNPRETIALNSCEHVRDRHRCSSAGHGSSCREDAPRRCAPCCVRWLLKQWRSEKVAQRDRIRELKGQVDDG